MALERIHLRKLLKMMFLPPNGTRSEIRADIREDIARDEGSDSSGGDFYVPFWADAKDHVFAHADIHNLVEQRISANRGRRHLYPPLRDGFLLWWNEWRRRTNEPFRLGRPLNAHFLFPGLEATVKVENVLCVRDGLDVEHYVYPYFSPDPVLSEEAARLGLWLLTSALPTVPQRDIAILDVIRGQAFSLDRTPLRGNEEEEFRRRYAELLRLRDELRTEYD